MGNTCSDIREFGQESKMLEGLKRKHCLCLKLPYDAIIHHTINLQPYDKSKPLHFLMTADHQSCQVVELEVKAAFFMICCHGVKLCCIIMSKALMDNHYKLMLSYSWLVGTFLWTIHRSQTETRGEWVELLSDVFLLAAIFAHNSFPCRCSVKVADKREKGCSWRLISYLYLKWFDSHCSSFNHWYTL